ncbi:exosortase K [Desulfotomaculum arcticum]|uniref:Exosortase K n=1 Tax=Desulfotruncus arcticus DSM 17038 TaxID=1121424 RepID=A0A1I2QMD1_9FIRM|nr:exosortase K [Desulfotruncus arcticus]SFG29448.1 exosortase K [Desulfotomaculum arcticum] [Desulfotruncus arcticus DSM 17038]
MKDKAQSVLIYFLAVLVGLGLIYGVKTAQDAVLKILLYPHAKAAEMFYNIPLAYTNGIGYSSMDCAFTIGRDCMGSNFVVLMFIMNACMFAKHFNGLYKVLWFITSLIGAAAAGTLISSIRIIGSIPFVTHEKFALLHTGIGISLYFAALAASYISINKLIGGDKHESSY